MNKIYDAILAESPRKMIERLASRSTRVPFHLRPAVRLLLRTSNSITGVVIRIDETKDGPYAIVASGRAFEEMIVVSVDAVYAVCFTDVREVVHLLSDTIVRRLDYKPPSKLELAVICRKESVELEKTLGKPLALEADVTGLAVGDPMANLQDAVQATRAALEGIAQDQLGKEAVTAFARLKVVHRGGEPVAVAKEGTDLTMSLDLVAALPTDLDYSLTEALKAAL
jgi:hypothetical protein